ncbi:MAG: alkaline phosphatase family protein [Acidobacteria bacterium]|nr:alkaline phosphatase family protein [Acidobacteriota bacterium]
MYTLTRVVSLALASVLTIVVPGSVGLDAQAPRRDRHVIVISLDGFAAYALADPNIPVPTLRALAKNGVMASSMTPVNPTVTWPNHTTLVTGVPPAQHGLLYNGLPVRAAAGATGPYIRVEPYVDKTTLVTAPTVYDAAHAAGLTTAEVDWVAIQNAPTITYAFPEYRQTQGAVAQAMIAAGVITADDLERFAKAPITFRDEIWTRAGEYIIRTHKPNLLLFHLLTTDSMQHQTGARSLGAQTALALADMQVKRLVDATRDAGIFDRTTFVIVSDHGFKLVERRVRANVVLANAGLGDKAWAVPEGGTAMIYLTPAGQTSRQATIDAVRTAFRAADGVSAVITPAEMEAYGYPSPEKMARMADVVVAAADGAVFTGGTDGPAIDDVPVGANRGSHGYLASDPDMQAIFIASGAGVRKGATLGAISNLDVAPTVAAWLDVALPSAAGKRLPIVE